MIFNFKRPTSLKDSSLGFALGVFLVLGVFIYALYGFAAWTNPTAVPTAGNVTMPLFTGTTTAPITQTRYGTLKLGSTTPVSVASNFFVYNGGISISSTTATGNELIIGNSSLTTISAGYGFVSNVRSPVKMYDAVNKGYADGAYLSSALNHGYIIAGNLANTAAATSTIFLSNNNVGIGTTDPTSKMAGTFGLAIYNSSGPGISWSNSSGRNWLLYKSGDDFRMYNQIDADVITLKAGGNVGIGTTNPSSGALQIQSSLSGAWAGYFQNTNANGAGLYVYSGNNSTQQAFQVGSAAQGAIIYARADGNVGIGTTNPGYDLDVQGAQSEVNVKSTTATNRADIIFVGGQTAAVGVESSAGGSLIGGSTAYAAVFGSVGAYPTQFGTNNTVKMTILSSGNIGIGTTNPGGLFDIGGDGIYVPAANHNVLNDAYNTNGAATFWINYSGYQAGTTQFRDFAVGDGKNNIKFYLTGSTGNVGIGTSSSVYYELDVNGHGRFNGDVKVNGQITAGSGDVAEEFYIDKEYPAGTVLVMDDKGYKSSRACDKKNDPTVIGVISEQPGMVVGQVEGKYKAPVALTGVIKVRVNATGGQVRKGDLLATSAVTGEAMKAVNPAVGTSIGKALENDTGKGWVMAIVNLK
jgi:trimeric autotransporter adhesin